MDDQLIRLETENRHLKISVHELEVLNEISRDISSALPAEDISRRIMKKVTTTLEAGEAAIFIFSENRADLTPRTFVRGKFDSMNVMRNRLDIQISGEIARTKEPLVINDPTASRFLLSHPHQDNPIHSLAAVPLLVKGRLIGVLAVFNSLKPTGFSKDDVRLLSIIGVQSAQILENARLLLEKIQYQGEIEAARKVQQGFLPTIIPKLPGLDIYGGLTFAKEIGGDLYDFIPVSEDRLYFSIGDVAGKGLPAALLMGTFQGQIRLLVNKNPSASPADIMTDLNQIACRMCSNIQFVTMIIGYISTKTGIVTFARGGHCYPLVIRPDGKIDEVTEGSCPIGKLDYIEFSDISVQLSQGSTLILVSDGIHEAFNAEEEQFGAERLNDILCRFPQTTAEELYHCVIQAVAEFRNEAEQSDDMTLLIIKRIK